MSSTESRGTEIGAAPPLHDLLVMLRELPESGRCRPIDAHRAVDAGKRVLAIFKEYTGAPYARLLTLCIDLLADGGRGIIEADMTRLYIFAANRQAAAQRDMPERVIRALTIAWNGVAPPGHHVRIGNKRGAAPHAGDLRDVFFDRDATGRHRRPRGAEDTAHISLSHLARVLGWSLGGAT